MFRSTIASAYMLLLCSTVQGPLAGAEDATMATENVAATATEGGRPPEASGLEKATFGGGCFWCMEPPFDALEGVSSTLAGYSGGHVANPDYRAVSTGKTGHVEVVQVHYDPEVVRYETLLAVFWKNIDPITPNQQFCDRGPQYRSVIFYHDEQQRSQAHESLAKLQAIQRFDEPIVTEITALQNFYPAEDYHQDYYRKNPVRYKFYRYRCGRDKRLDTLWGTER